MINFPLIKGKEKKREKKKIKKKKGFLSHQRRTVDSGRSSVHSWPNSLICSRSHRRHAFYTVMMAEPISLTPAKGKESSKTSIARLAAQAQASSSKIELKSKWMSIFEQFMMVCIHSFYISYAFESRKMSHNHN
jgi:hypothetical protein